MFWLTVLPARLIAGPDRWTPAAPPDGGAVIAVAVNPQDPDSLFAATETAGVFHSPDGGASWQPARDGLPPGQTVAVMAAGGPDGRTLAAIVPTPDPIDVARDQLFVSSDGGGRWVQRTLPADLGPGWRQSTLSLLAMSPASARTLYLGFDGGQGGALYESGDGGLTWTDVWPTASNPEPWDLLDLVIAPSAPNVLYALAVGGEVLSSGDGGLHWSVAGAVGRDPVKLAVDPRDPNLLYAAALGRITSSSDGGHTWSRSRVVSALSLENNNVLVAIAVDPVHRGTLYYEVAYLTGIVGDYQDDTIEFKFVGLLFRSRDDGRSWTRQPATQGIYALAAVASPAASSGTRLYAGATQDGVLRSDDGGLSWQPAASGLKAAPSCSLAADPFIPQLLYLSTGFCVDSNSDMGFRRSGSGHVWTAVNRGLREPGRQLDAFGIVADPRSPGTLYALTGQGLYKSADRGAHWRPLRSLVSDQEAVTSFAIDPLESRRLYATGYALSPDCASSTCAYFAAKSADAGETWSELLPDTSYSYLEAVAVDPQDPDILYVSGGFPERSFPPKSNLLKSTDRGRTWVPLQVLFGGILDPVTQLLIHPQDDRVLFATSFTHGGEPRIVKSTDGGQTWVASAGGLPANCTVLSLAVDPTRRSTLYAGTDQGFFVSDDGGGSWRLLADGLRDPVVWEVLVDPFDPLTLYAGTHSDGGLFVLTRSTPP